VCVCLCVCIFYHSSECYKCFKAKVRCQQKALNAENKINIGIKLKILGSKVLTVIAYHEISTWCLWQEIDASKSLVLLEEDYVKHCLHL